MDVSNVDQSTNEARSKTVFRRFRKIQQALKRWVRMKIPLLPTSLCWTVDLIGYQNPRAGKIAILVPVSIFPRIELLRLNTLF